MFKKVLVFSLAAILITVAAAGIWNAFQVENVQAAEMARRGPGGANGAGIQGGYASNDPLEGSAAPAPAAGYAQGAYGNGARRGGQGAGQGQAASGAALQPLSEAEATALQDAIREEYGAQALYASVLAAFGDAAPFNTIVVAEQRHAQALINLAERYGVAVPQYPADFAAPAFEDISAACAAGVQAEVADAALYDRLLAINDHPDLERVFTNLQRASLNSHLPAFEACR
jgi:hypothetical protein